MKTASSQSVISMLVVVIFGGVLFLLLMRPITIDLSVKDLLLILFGILASKFGSVVDFYMGSSVGSKHANETLSQLATGAGTSTTITGTGTTTTGIDLPPATV